MKMKRTLVGLLCLCVALGATACGGKKADDELLLFINNGNNYEGATKDRVWLALEENTGVKLSFTGATHGATYYTKLNPLMNTITNMPDIIFTVPDSADMGQSTFSDWTDPETGLLYSFDELLRAYPAGTFPYLEKIFASDVYGRLVHNNGHYLLPNLSSRNSSGIYYRTDWLINVGYYLKDADGQPILDADGKKQPRYPVNMDEFTEVLRLFTENDPDGNGQKDTYGYSPSASASSWGPLYHAFGVAFSWDIDSAGNVDYAYTNPKYKNFLTWAHDMYQKGYIYPTFNSLPNQEDRNLFYNNKIGVLITNAESHVMYIMNRMTSLGHANDVGFGPAPVGTDTIGEKGSGGFSDYGGYWGGYSITRNCKNTEGALRFLNYILSPEGAMLRSYGIEGTHYQLVDGAVEPNLVERAKEGDGKFVQFKVGDVSAAYGRYLMGSTFGHIVDWDEVDRSGNKNYTFKISAGAIDPQYTDLVQQALDNLTLKSSKLVNITAYEPSVLSQMAFVADESLSFVNSAIIGSKNLTSDWDAMIARCKDSKWNIMTASIKQTAEKLGVAF